MSVNSFPVPTNQELHDKARTVLMELMSNDSEKGITAKSKAVQMVIQHIPTDEEAPEEETSKDEVVPTAERLKPSADVLAFLKEHQA